MIPRKTIEKLLMNLSNDKKWEKSWDTLLGKYIIENDAYIYDIACNSQSLNLRINAIHLLLGSNDNRYFEIIQKGLLVKDKEFLYSLVMFTGLIKKPDVVSLLYSLIIDPGLLKEFELESVALNALKRIGLISVPVIVRLLILENKELENSLKEVFIDLISSICTDESEMDGYI